MRYSQPDLNGPSGHRTARRVSSTLRAHRSNQLTQAEAAKRMRTTQPRINGIVQGRNEKCTIDRLVNMLATMGRHVSLTVDKSGLIYRGYR
ncbi:MAG: helix-turn-helix domain-containing protein [Gammaproteobacteria bacterium]